MKSLLKRAVEVSGLELTEDQRIHFVFVGARKIVEVNRRFLDRDNVTDVICFDYRDGDDTVPGGEEETAMEILICVDKAVMETEAHPEKHSYGGELALYIVHAILHATGEDDLDPEAKKRMRAAERRVLNVLCKEFDFNQIFKLKKCNEK